MLLDVVLFSRGVESGYSSLFRTGKLGLKFSKSRLSFNRLPLFCWENLPSLALVRLVFVGVIVVVFAFTSDFYIYRDSCTAAGSSLFTVLN